MRDRAVRPCLPPTDRNYLRILARRIITAPVRTPRPVVSEPPSISGAAAIAAACNGTTDTNARSIPTSGKIFFISPSDFVRSGGLAAAEPHRREDRVP